MRMRVHLFDIKTRTHLVLICALDHEALNQALDEAEQFYDDQNRTQKQRLPPILLYKFLPNNSTRLRIFQEPLVSSIVHSPFNFANICPWFERVFVHKSGRKLLCFSCSLSWTHEIETYQDSLQSARETIWQGISLKYLNASQYLNALIYISWRHSHI